MRISHSHFLGGPPTWTEEDQDKAVAYERYLRSVCVCGTREDEWEEDRFAYVGYAWKCPGCELIELEQGNLPKDAKGWHVGLVPRELADAMDEQKRQAVVKDPHVETA